MSEERCGRRLLVVAPRLPRYDRNSGDQRLFRLLEMFSRGHRVVFLAQGPTGDGPEAEARYRASVEALGVDAYVGDRPLIGILGRSRFRMAFLEFHHVASYYLPRIRILRPDCPVVVDSVDLHYLRHQLKYRVTGSPMDLETARLLKAAELDVYRKADVVVTVTDEDAAVLRADAPGIRVRTIPNIHQPQPISSGGDGRALLFVGGFSHEPNVDAALHLCREILPKVRENVPDVRLTIAGSDPPEALLALRSDRVAVTGFVPSLEPLFRSHRVSVAPLRYGAGMKGKIGEAMAHGLPVVTTSVGAQGMGLVHGVNAMIADAPREFADAVVSLIADDSLHESVRRNAMAHVAATCGPERVAVLIDSLLEELAGIAIHGMSLTEKVGFLLRRAAGRGGSAP